MKQPQPTQQPAAEASAGVLAQAAETLQKQQAAAAAEAAAAAAQAQYQMDQKKGPTAAACAVAPSSAGMPQGEKSVEENGSGGVVEQAARKPMPGQVKTHQPLHKDNSGEWLNLNASSLALT